MRQGRRLWSLGMVIGLQLCLSAACQTVDGARIGNRLFEISWAESAVSSWKYTLLADGGSVNLKLPVLSIDGKRTPVVLRRLVSSGGPVSLRNGTTEHTYEGALESDETIHVQVKFRIAGDNPVVRFQYSLKSSRGQKLTKTDGKDDLVYVSYSAGGYSRNKEIRLSVFNEMIHSCHLSEMPLSGADFANSASFAGPILLSESGRNAFLCAYEHGSMYQNRYLEYRAAPGGDVALGAVKGNYYDGQSVDGYSTIWFEVGGVTGGEEELASEYRMFALKYLSNNMESRKPYIYYSTWGRQERVKWAGGRYLDTMNLEYTLREIDRAHDMGIEVYVLDTGWFDRTGDWGVNKAAFPDGFLQIREKIEGYGMRFGVWIDPEKAAMSSVALQKNLDCVKTSGGKAGAPDEVWETEKSTGMCLVSRYWEHYAGVIIGLYNELGIRYFYFDGVGQSGCDDPGHFHGRGENSTKERQDCFGFLMPVYLGKIIDKVTETCPEAIFDFDVTESGRIGVGLGFLACGRYFILNNGPYFHNFDLCAKGKSVLANGCRNIFINPGPSRTWFMRSVLDYDRWIPSNLFMANYQPDDPEDSQTINLASLVLGQNAVWGDILKTSPEGVALFHDVLEKYKQVRDDVAEASAVRVGNAGDTPEIFEKINPRTGRGVIAIFANSAGAFSYVTRHPLKGSIWHNDGVTLETGSDGHAKIAAEFARASAKMVFSGVE